MANEDVRDVAHFCIAIIVIAIIVGGGTLAYLAYKCYVKEKMFSVIVAIVSGSIVMAFAVAAICMIIHFIKE